MPNIQKKKKKLDKDTESKQAGRAYQQEKHKRIAQGASKDEALRAISEREQRAAANTPEAIAQKSLDIEAEKERLTREKIISEQPTDTPQVEEVTEEGPSKGDLLKESFGTKEGLKELFLGSEDIQQGTLPISPAGGAAAIAGAPKLFKAAGTSLGKIEKGVENILKGNSLAGLSPARKAIVRELAAKRISNLAGISNNAAIRLINSYTKWNKGKIINFLGSKPLKTSLKVGAAVAGAVTIWSWYALDNIGTGMEFLVPNVQQGIQTGTLTIEEATDLFSEADIAYDLALTKVNQSARYNPLTWASRKMIVTGAEFKRKVYELKKENFKVNLGL